MLCSGAILASPIAFCRSFVASAIIADRPRVVAVAGSRTDLIMAWSSTPLTALPEVTRITVLESKLDDSSPMPGLMERLSNPAHLQLDTQVLRDQNIETQQGTGSNECNLIEDLVHRLRLLDPALDGVFNPQDELGPVV